MIAYWMLWFMEGYMSVALAGGVIQNGAGEVLLLHRNTKMRCKWELPGGKIEKNESPKQVVRRELSEEIGIEVHILDFIGKVSFIEDGVTMDYIWYDCDIRFDSPCLMENKFDDLRYWNISELEKIEAELFVNMRKLLPILKERLYMNAT